MGMWFGWLQCNNVAELEKEKSKLLAKQEQLNAELEALDEKIAELKAKGEN